MFALVDCNNFYASCERAFNPSLIGKSIVVLSNNDGCIVARSQEAKDLGIKMGVPAFEIENFLIANKVNIFSSNYALYGDMSGRVQQVLSKFSPFIENYSIDESFLDLSNFDYKDLTEYAKEIKKTVQQWTGIPVSVGIAPTKSLSKLANKLSKKEKVTGVKVLQTIEQITEALKIIPIEDVWGIGSQYARKLKYHNINTAYDLTQMPDTWIKQTLSIVGFRLVQELRGTPCLALETVAPAKKGICTACSFGTPVNKLNIIKEALATYVARCAEKLRKQNSCANLMSVFLETNPFRKDQPQYYPHKTIALPVATNSTAELIKYATNGIELIFKEGYLYKKTGVMLTGIVPETNIQQNLFDTTNRKTHDAIMGTMDKLNGKFGRDTVRFAVQGFKKEWKLRQEKLSPRYTTRWTDIIKVNV